MEGDFMNMPIKVIYYYKKKCSKYMSEIFTSYEDFGKWYLDNRLKIGIMNIKELKKEELEWKPTKVTIGKMTYDSFW